MSRAFADTTALIPFFTATGILNERLLAGMAWERVFHARLLGAALTIPCGRPHGLFLNGVRALFGVPERALNTRAG